MVSGTLAEFEADASLLKTQVQAYLTVAEAKAINKALRHFADAQVVRKLWHDIQPVLLPEFQHVRKSSIMETIARLLPAEYRGAFEELMRQSGSEEARTSDPSYLHRGITREEAEKRLRAAGSRDGQFLVRDEGEQQYDLVLVFRSRCVHFRVEWDRFVNKLTINRQSYGESTTLERLIANLQNDGLTKGWVYPLTLPVESHQPVEFPARQPAASPTPAVVTSSSVTGNTGSIDSTAGVTEVDPMQPLFMHGTISRLEAEARLAGKQDDSFLVRKKADKHFVLTTILNGRPCHFPLDWDPLLGKFALNKKTCGTHHTPHDLVEHVREHGNWQHPLTFPVSRLEANTSATTTTMQKPKSVDYRESAQAMQNKGQAISAQQAAPAVTAQKEQLLYAALDLPQHSPAPVRATETVVYSTVRTERVAPAQDEDEDEDVAKPPPVAERPGVAQLSPRVTDFLSKNSYEPKPTPEPQEYVALMDDETPRIAPVGNLVLDRIEKLNATSPKPLRKAMPRSPPTLRSQHPSSASPSSPAAPARTAPVPAIPGFGFGTGFGGSASAGFQSTSAAVSDVSPGYGFGSAAPVAQTSQASTARHIDAAGNSYGF